MSKQPIQRADPITGESHLEVFGDTDEESRLEQTEHMEHASGTHERTQYLPASAAEIVRPRVADEELAH